MIEVLGKDAVLDEDFLAGVHALIVHRVSTVAAHHGWVVHHGYEFVANFLTEFSVQTRIAGRHQISLTGVAERFMDVDARQIFVSDERKFS